MKLKYYMYLVINCTASFILCGRIRSVQLVLTHIGMLISGETGKLDPICNFLNLSTLAEFP